MPDPLNLHFSEDDNLEKLIEKNLDSLTLKKKIIYFIIFSKLEDSEMEILALINILQRNDLFELIIDLLEKIEVLKMKMNDERKSFEKFKYFLNSFHIFEPSEKIIDFISNLLKNDKIDMKKDLDYYIKLFINDIKSISNADEIIVKIMSFLFLKIIQIDEGLVDKTTFSERVNKIRGVMSDKMSLFNYMISLNMNSHAFD